MPEPLARSSASERIAAESSADVLFEASRGIGWILLNRPRAINAANHGMVRAIAAMLAAWQYEDAVQGVVIHGAGERGFCAGGDLRSIYDDALSGGTASLDFWRDEYALNAQMAEYPKPMLSIMDGLVMGGGVGLSAHCRIRLVTDRTSLAMPEVSIGFVPDVGGTWLLAKAPGQIGLHMALTGRRCDAADAIAAGFADRYLPASELDGFLDRLDGDQLASLPGIPAPAPNASSLLAQRAWIDACYQADSAAEAVARLRQVDDPAAAEAADGIEANSPIAVSVALRAIRAARQLPSLRHALAQELRVAAAGFASHDFIEGIRAQTIDKDRQPHWSPATLADVTDAQIERYFAPIAGEDELREGIRR